MAFPIVPLVMAGLQIASAVSNKNKRPKAEVTGATNEMVESARMDAQATQRAGRSMADENIRQNTANSIANVQRNTNDVNKILAAASAAQGSENQAMRQQDALDAQAQEEAKRRLQNALGQKSAEQQRVWSVNEGIPYQQAEMQRQQNIGAGIQNINTTYSDHTNYKRWLEMFGNNKNTTWDPDNKAIAAQVEADRPIMMGSGYKVWGATPKLGQATGSYPYIRKI